jgi:hypothetical protein
MLTLPVLVQFYDEPMPFGFFSPDQYIEVGPGASLALKAGEHWNVDLDGRAGGQRESGRSWSPLVTANGALWRDISAEWHLRAELGWSNSNLASSGSFERTSFAVSVARSF